MSAQTQSTAQLEIINVKSIQEFEEKVWDAIDKSDVPISEMHFILQKIAHAILEESCKGTDEDED